MEWIITYMFIGATLLHLDIIESDAPEELSSKLAEYLCVLWLWPALGFVQLLTRYDSKREIDAFELKHYKAAHDALATRYNDLVDTYQAMSGQFKEARERNAALTSELNTLRAMRPVTPSKMDIYAEQVKQYKLNANPETVVDAQRVGELVKEQLADAWLDRVKAERNELSERLARLHGALNNPAIPLDQRDLMTRQSWAMNAYLSALDERIQAAETKGGVDE